jgi:L-threonylcarbamoyladenylate synthase
MGVVEQAVAALRSGQLAILPTDTVYGLCARVDDEEAVAQLQRLKGRPQATPVALLCSNLEQLLGLLPDLSGPAGGPVRALLPGPFTLVVRNPERRFPWLGGARPETIGVRVPSLVAPARAVLEQVGAVAATSANRHGGPDPKRLAEVPQAIRDACGAELDGGELPGIPSTVVDLTGPEPQILREGVVGADETLRQLAAARPKPE